jgi:hypothetical protein
VRLSKKIAASVSIVAAGTLVAGIAFAAWTATGDGSGSAKSGQSTAVSTVATSAVTSLLYPTGSADVKVNVHNSNPYAVTVTAINNAAGGSILSGDGTCDASNGVTFTNTPVVTGGVVGAGLSAEFILTGAAHMSNLSVDACQNKSFSIPVTVVAASS